MKRYLLTILFGLLTCALMPMTAQAQKKAIAITRTILGGTLGVSTREQVKAHVLKVGGEIALMDSLINGSTRLMARGLTFAGSKPAAVCFLFVDNLLSSVSISMNDEEEADKMKSMLSRKYPKWVDFPLSLEEEKETSYQGGFIDSRTALCLYYYNKDKETYPREFERAVLAYVDLKTTNQAMDRQSADL